MPEDKATTSPWLVRNRTCAPSRHISVRSSATEHHRFGESAADRCQCLRIAVAGHVDQRACRKAEGAQTVQEDVVEAELARRRGIDVQWVAVAAETINRGLLGPDHVDVHRVGSALRVVGRAGPR